MAHENASPATTAIAVEIPARARGIARDRPPPSPSWPASSAPQQNTAPPGVAAQVWRWPAATEIAPGNPTTPTSSERGVCVVSPSWPESFRPQHDTE